MILGNHARGAYLQPDLREVRAAGVNHVMRLFMRHYADLAEAQAPAATAPRPAPVAGEDIARILCDEVALAKPTEA